MKYLVAEKKTHELMLLKYQKIAIRRYLIFTANFFLKMYLFVFRSFGVKQLTSPKPGRKLGHQGAICGLNHGTW